MNVITSALIYQLFFVCVSLSLFHLIEELEPSPHTCLIDEGPSLWHSKWKFIVVLRGLLCYINHKLSHIFPVLVVQAIKLPEEATYVCILWRYI